MTKLTTHFALEEFFQSSTAAKYNIDNTPDPKSLDNIYRLAQVLQIIRDHFGSPIRISSGFRSKALNNKIGGATNSDHMFGAAADIQSCDNKKLFDTIKGLIADGTIELRQLIDEYDLRWVHIAINHDRNPYKKNQILKVG